MNRMSRLAIWVLCMAFASVEAAAGFCFISGSGASQPVENPGLVAPFIDAGGAAFGQALAPLLRRQVLMALDDPDGGQVALAQEAGKERLVDLLARRSHAAADDIARRQGASMALWGDLQTQDDRFFVTSFLTVPSDLRDPGLREQGMDLQLADDGQALAGAAAGVFRARLNFTPVEIRRQALTPKRLTPRDTALLRTQPNASAPIAGQVSNPEVLEVLDIALDTGAAGTAWYAVRRPHGATAYLAAAQANALPDAAGVSLASPLAAAQFMAALLHYQARRFDAAQQAFAQFTQTFDGAVKPVNLAAAHRLQGASALLSKGCSGFDDSDLEPFDRAVNLTPNDPTAYTLRALARVGIAGQLTEAALADLQQALELDVRNQGARRLVQTFAALGGPDSGAAQALDAMPCDARPAPGASKVQLAAQWMQYLLSIDAVARVMSRISSGRHVPLPATLDSIDDPTVTAGDTRVTVNNHTGRTLRMYIAGLTHCAMAITSQASAQVNLSTGQYNLAVEIPDEALIFPVYGEQRYESGKHYTLDLHMRWNDRQLQR